MRVVALAKHLNHGGHHARHASRLAERDPPTDKEEKEEADSAVVAFWMDEAFDFHINEHSAGFEFTLYDAKDLLAAVLGRAQLSLKEVRRLGTDKTATTTTIGLVDAETAAETVSSFEVRLTWDKDSDSVPDFHFLSTYTADNHDRKPQTCGVESWIWMKGPDYHTFHRRWAYLTTADDDDGPVRFGYIDGAASEFEINEEFLAGRLARHVHELAATAVVNLENTALAEWEVEHESKKLRGGDKHHLTGRKMRQADVKSQEFQFQTQLKSGDHHHNALHTHGKHPRVGCLHVHVISASGVHGKTLSGGVDTYVRLQLDKAKLSSATVKYCADPAWEEAFVLPVWSEESDLAVAIFADRPGFDDELCRATVRLKARVEFLASTAPRPCRSSGSH